MHEETTITVSRSFLFERGDYISMEGGTHRAVGVTATTLTTRPLHRWRWVEWLRAKWEDRIAWPIDDGIRAVRRWHTERRGTA